MCSGPAVRPAGLPDCTAKEAQVRVVDHDVKGDVLVDMDNGDSWLAIMNGKAAIVAVAGNEDWAPKQLATWGRTCGSSVKMRCNVDVTEIRQHLLGNITHFLVSRRGSPAENLKRSSLRATLLAHDDPNCQINRGS